jgi:hypothetical protein
MNNFSKLVALDNRDFSRKARSMSFELPFRGAHFWQPVLGVPSISVSHLPKEDAADASAAVPNFAYSIIGSSFGII